MTPKGSGIHVTGASPNLAFVWVNELNWLLRRFGDVTRQVAATAASLELDATPEQIITEFQVNFDESLLTSVISELRSRTGIDPTHV
jgi:hypothetical protein